MRTTNCVGQRIVAGQVIDHFAVGEAPSGLDHAEQQHALVAIERGGDHLVRGEVLAGALDR